MQNSFSLEDYTKQLRLLYLIRHMNQEESETEDDLLYLKVYDITYTKKMTILYLTTAMHINFLLQL